jgi:hypothetical protein
LRIIEAAGAIVITANTAVMGNTASTQNIDNILNPEWTSGFMRRKGNNPGEPPIRK